ncbi:permease-like cell division protein FtsX [Pseudoduganella sp. SL102]|uniref:Cell division protein FtsX n=1 Tax=Pseudoduganella albidiflava TaxID=321983 RepID=A0A411X3R9_9BURK|nr:MULTISPECIES: permease-like cell division protein FtsX [Pseudoduganella]QBI03512.1 FtsX-like permease family protein [Pseudoduganella albidiflava]WBS03960.1 permease-like cell division protein FtsX [Pseudoduganella sp. SL102]GGY50618.1 cell division protein FtsX [Pseudoduganella albidiflava]
MSVWLRQHGFALGAAVGHLRRSPGSFFFNILVVAIALALPFAGVTVLDNIRPMSEQLAVDPELSVFLKQDLPREHTQGMAGSLRAVAKDARIVFVPREKALEELQEKNGVAGVIDTLGENPLPDSYIVRLNAFQSAAESAHVDDIADSIRAIPGVESVQVDSEWVKRLAALLGVLRVGLLLLAATLGTVVVAVVFNTIRLQVLTQREEILVSRLIGATDTYIQRPFYYTGALLGLFAGAVALGAVALSLHPLNAAIAEFARLYASEFQLAPLEPLAMALLLALSAGLGLVGAALSVRRQLARLA